MKMLLFSSLVIAASISSSAFASQIDFETVRKLAPAGSDIAKYQLAISRGADPKDAAGASVGSMIISDFNKDGIYDVAVVFEKNPTFVGDDNQSCTYDSSKPAPCFLIAGDRTLQLFLGQKDGSLKLAASNDKIVLGAQDGGAFGDPLNDLSLNARGSLQLQVYGGSTQRWWHEDIIQFRGNGFYLVGQTDGHMEGGNPETSSVQKETNLLTGEVITTKGKHAPVHSKIRVKPLVNLNNYSRRLLGEG